MAKIEESIEVQVPVQTAYNQWTQFEEFPTFMEGIEQVRQLDDRHLHWVAEVGGTREEWDAEITEQHPDERVAWTATSGKGNAGVVTFHRIGEAQTKIMVQIDWEPEGVKEKLGATLGMDNRRVQGDLQRFKELDRVARAPSRAPGAVRSRIRPADEDVHAALAGVTAAAVWAAAEPAAPAPLRDAVHRRPPDRRAALAAALAPRRDGRSPR